MKHFIGSRLLALGLGFSGLNAATVFAADSNSQGPLEAATVSENFLVQPSPDDILQQSSLTQLLSIDSSYLEDKLRALTGETPVTINGRTINLGERNTRLGKQQALAYLQQEFKEIGYSTYLVPYGTGTNFIAEKQGAASNRQFIIAAHYDTVSTVGADDDGSGVIGSLAIAASIKDLPLAYSLRVVFFDEEELGLVGSKNYVSSLKNSGGISELIGVLVLEMLGYDEDKDGMFHIIDCARSPSRPAGASGKISSLIAAAVSQADLPLVRRQACTNRSDHTSFWQANRPAVVLTQNFFGGDSNPCYHRRCDRVDRLDFTYMSHLTSAAASAVASIITSQE